MVQRQNTPKIETCNWKSEKCEKLVWKRWDFCIDYQVPKHRVLCTAFLSVWFMLLIQCCEPLKVKDSGDTLRMVLNADLIFKCHDCHLVLILIWLDLIFIFIFDLPRGWVGRQAGTGGMKNGTSGPKVAATADCVCNPATGWESRRRRNGRFSWH